MASPRYSKTWPVPPPMPIRAISARMMSFAAHPGGQAAVDAHLVGLRVALEQGLGREDHLDLARPDPEREGPERAVRAGVRVAADDRHAGLREPELRPDDMDDPLARRADAVERDPELRAVGLELRDLRRGHRIEDGQRARGRRDGVVRGGHGLARMPDPEAAGTEPAEGLRTGHLVHEVEVHGEDGGRARVLRDDVVIPDLGDDGARFGHATQRSSQGPKTRGAGVHCAGPAAGRRAGRWPSAFLPDATRWAQDRVSHPIRARHAYLMRDPARLRINPRHRAGSVRRIADERQPGGHLARTGQTHRSMRWGVGAAPEVLQWAVPRAHSPFGPPRTITNLPLQGGPRSSATIRNDPAASSASRPIFGSSGCGCSSPS